MALEDFGLEGLSDRLIDAAKPKAWRTRATGALTVIDEVFKAMEAIKTEYASDVVVVTEIDTLTTQLKSAMFNIYQAH